MVTRKIRYSIVLGVPNRTLMSVKVYRQLNLIIYFRYYCTDSSFEIAVVSNIEYSHMSDIPSMDFVETLNRTGLSRWSFTCDETGHFGFEKDSKSNYILPITCIPRGK